MREQTKEHLRRLAHRLFLAGDLAHVHVLPVHYYTPVASRRQLRRTEAQWRRPLDPIPFEWDLDAQAAWLVEQTGRFPAELPLARLYEESERVGGFRYGPIEAQFLYSYLRTNAPRRIVEIGSGSSTLVMSLAVAANVAEGRPASNILACDPYVVDRVSGLPHVTTTRTGALELWGEVLDLADGDLLFVDSTHVVRTGSELFHLYLELLPRLRAGVTVHIHDINLPYVFQPDFYATLFDWQETTLVAALLTGNDRLSIKTCMSGLFHDRPGALAHAFPEYRPRDVERGIGADPSRHYPSALWLRTRSR